MSYVISTHSISRVKAYLDKINSDPQSDHSFPADNPHNLAYLLRQAFASAEKLDDPEYKGFSKAYKVRPKRDRVIVEYQGFGTVVQMESPKIKFFKDVVTEDDMATMIAMYFSDFEKLQFPFIFSDIPARIDALCFNFKLAIKQTQDSFGKQIWEVTRHVV